MRDFIEFITFMVFMLTLVAVLTYGIVALRTAHAPKCIEGYHWSYNENLCLNGYDPYQGR